MLNKGELLHTVASDSQKFYMKLGKSALGKNRPASIGVPVISTYDDLGNESITFDWDTPLVELLSNDKVIGKTLLSEVMHLAGDGNKWSSSTLGLKDVSKREMGAAIHANALLVHDLQTKVLRIRIKRKWGVDVTSAEQAGPQTEGLVTSDADEEDTDENPTPIPTLDGEENAVSPQPA